MGEEEEWLAKARFPSPQKGPTEVHLLSLRLLLFPRQPRTAALISKTESGQSHCNAPDKEMEGGDGLSYYLHAHFVHGASTSCEQLKSCCISAVQPGPREYSR